MTVAVDSAKVGGPINGLVDGYDVGTIGDKVAGLPDSAVQDVGQNGTTSATPRGRINHIGPVIVDNPGSNSKDVFPYIYSCLAADFTGTDDPNAQPVFPAAQDTITVEAATAYEFEALYHIHTLGTTSHSTSVLFGGTATLTSIGYMAMANQTATESSAAPSASWATSGAAVVVGAAVAAATHNTILLKGVIRVNAAGTLVPQFKFSAAPGAAPTVLANSYFKLRAIGINTDVSKGAVA